MDDAGSPRCQGGVTETVLSEGMGKTPEHNRGKRKGENPERDEKKKSQEKQLKAHAERVRPRTEA